MSEWLPGIVALCVGAAAAGAFLRASRVRTLTEDEVLATHERALDLFVDQLRELSVEEHLFDPQTYAEEKGQLEEAAATALASRDAQRERLRRDSREAPVVEVRQLPSGFWRRHPRLGGAAWGAAGVGFVWALWAQVSTATPRETPPSRKSYDSLLVLSAIALETGDSDKLLSAWGLYLREPEPRRIPPALQRASDWLEQHLDE